MTRAFSCNLGLPYRILMPMAIVAGFAPTGPAFAAEMRYDIKPEQVVPYRVTIVADTPTEKDTMSGVIAFTGKKSGAEEITVVYQGGLTRKKQAKGSSSTGRGPSRGPRGFPGRPGGGPPISRGPMSRFASGTRLEGLTQTSSELVVGRDGEIKRMTGDSQLPYLLGNLSLLVFESLPSGDQKQWKSESGISITEGRSSRFPPRGPFGSSQQETKTGGSETASYTTNSDDGKRVSIQKSYRLNSPAASKDDQTLEIKGNGTFVFNRELGVPESLDFKQDLIVKGSGVSVTVPMTVAWNRISDEEYQAHIKARQDQLAALREQVEQRKSKTGSQGKAADAKPIDPKLKQEILADLRSDSWPKVTARLGRLASYKPHPDDADVALAIRDLQNHSNAGVSMRAKLLWKKWSVVVDGSGSGAGTSEPTKNPFESSDEVGHQIRTWSDITLLSARLVRDIL